MWRKMLENNDDNLKIVNKLLHSDKNFLVSCLKIIKKSYYKSSELLQTKTDFQNYSEHEFGVFQCSSQPSRVKREKVTGRKGLCLWFYFESQRQWDTVRVQRHENENTCTYNHTRIQIFSHTNTKPKTWQEKQPESFFLGQNNIGLNDKKFL